MKQKAYRFDSEQEKQQLVNHYGEDFFKFVPTGTNATTGYLYGVGDGWGWTSATREKFQTDRYYDNFEEVLINHLGDSLESQIARAKTYIGQTVRKSGTTYDIVNVRVVMSDSEPDLTCRVVELLQTNPWVVCIVSDLNTTLPIMDKNFNSVPTNKTIKLTSDYDAVVYKDKVVVGCQTIPVEKIEEILTIVEELN